MGSPAFGEDYRPRYNPAFERRAKAKRAEIEAADAAMRREARRAMLMAEAEKARIQIMAAKAAKLAAPPIEMPLLLPLTEIERIIRRALRVFGCSRVHLMGRGRQRRLAMARHFICYWACRRTGLSLPQIGRKLGNRDHTTALHSARVYPQKRAEMGRTLRPAR